MGTLLGSCLIAAFALSPSRAQNRVSESPDKLVPKDSLLFVRWDGTKAHAQAFSETAAHEALYESGLVPVLEKAFQGIVDQAGPNGAMLDGPAGQAFSHVKDNGVRLAVALAAPSPNGPPMPLPYAVVVFPDGGQFAEPLGRLLQQMAGMEVESQEIDGRRISSFVVPDTPGIEVGWWVEGEHLIVAAGMNALPTAIAVASGELPNITANPLWKEFGPESVDFEMTGLSWFDLGKLRDAYGEMPVPIPISGPNGAPFTVNQIAKVAGLDNVGATVSQSGYKGKALWSETVLQVDGEKRGLLALSDHEPITFEQLPPLPSDTMTFAAGSFSLSKFYDDLLDLVRDAAKLGPPEIAQQIEQGIEAAPQIIGFDPKTDLFDTLGNVTTFYSDASQDFYFFGLGGIAVAVEVKDSEKLKRTLDQILLMAEAAGGGEFSVIRKEKHGRQIITFEIEGVEFGGLVVDKDWIIAGLVPQTAETALLRIDGKLDRFTPSRELQVALNAMPKEFTSITVSSPRRTYRALMGYAPLLWTLGKAGLRESGMFPAEIELPVTLADIPPSDIVARPLFPNVLMSESTDMGFRWVSRGSLPSLPFVGDGGGIGSVGSIGVLTALLLPAVQQAREAARRSQSKSNMKQIMIAMHNYHDVYRNFPTGTIEDSAEAPDDRLSWLVSILPFADQAPLYEQIDRKSAWDSDANAEWTSFDINTFLNPSNPNVGEGSTHYIGMAGIGKDAAKLKVNDPRAGVFGYDRKTRIRDIKDGTSNTIAITDASDDLGPWAKGGKSTIRALTEKPYINGPDGIGGPHQGGIQAGLTDGSVRFISENIDPEVFKALITINGGERIPAF